VTSGLFASVALPLPFLIAVLGYLIIFGIVLTFQEPHNDKAADGQAPRSYREVLRRSVVLMRARPALRYPMIYLAIVPLAALILETLFVQPQTMALGVPLAGIGVVIMGLQMTNMVGAGWSDWLGNRLGERRILYATPLVIVTSLMLLAALQVLSALFFMVVVSFVTAVQRPSVLSYIQSEVSDDIRATLLSMQSLMFTIVAAIAQPTLGFVADQAGLPAAYVALAGSLSFLILFLLWASYHHFPGIHTKTTEVLEVQ
jgi:predicted MFS family arabinose efflux permease